MKSRALRRHHLARLKKARRWHWGRDLGQEPRTLGLAVNTPCICSCWMCRPRKHAGPTVQERRAPRLVATDLPADGGRGDRHRSHPSPGAGPTASSKTLEVHLSWT
jgi:hypothetical protein